MPKRTGKHAPASRIQTSPNPRPAPFESQLETAIARIRLGLADVLNSVGADATRPQEMARRLGLHRGLTWKISKILRERDPAAVVPLIPGKSGLTILFNSLRKAGADHAVIDRALQAFSEFRIVRDVHAGDRETLEIMLGNLAGSAAESQQHLETQRKFAFRGNSATWGVQARVQLCVNFIAPGQNSDHADLAWLSGLVDFRRLRRDATWPMASTRLVDDSGTELPIGTIESIDLNHDRKTAAPLFEPFCSSPLPKLRIRKVAGGQILYELEEGPIGSTAGATCIIGIIGRSFFRRTAAPGDTLGEHTARLYTPCELLIHDLFVHRDLVFAMNPEVHLYSQLPINPPYPTGGRDADQLPLAERVQSLGAGPPIVLTPELPQYHSMIDAVFHRAGWNPRDFHGFRLQVRYPPIPTAAVFRYPLPPAS